MPNDEFITLVKKFETEPDPETARMLKPLLYEEIEAIEQRFNTARPKPLTSQAISESSRKPMGCVRRRALM